MSIMTVTGPIKKENLEFCQCHEHLFIKEGKSKEINSALYLDDFEATVKELQTYKRSGGRSIVDAQPLGCGRMTNNLIKAAKDTGLNIIASTGFHKLMFYPYDHWIRNVNHKEFKHILKEEIEKGMYLNTEKIYPNKQVQAKAGIIKTAYSEEHIANIDTYEKLLAAAAQVAVDTDTTIMCHTDKGQGALKVIDILTDNGLSSNSIIICHLDRRIDNYDFHYKVADKGVYLDYDTIGRFKYHSDEEEINLIQNMINMGYLDNLLLALDTTRNRHKSYGGNIGLNYILETFIPLMKEAGIKSEQIKKMMIENPARVLD